jgi:hypothetical protein
VTAWTSSLAVIPASPSAQPESGSAQKTLGTSGLSSQTEFDFFAPDSAISRMSKDTSASDSEKSLESWNQSVTRRRGEYSARLKSAHLTRESGSLSWPSPIASEVRQGFQDRSRGMKGSQESLTTVVVKDAANWPTPAVMDVITPTRDLTNMESKGHWGKQPRNRPDGVGFIAPNTGKLSEMVKYGQAAPANHNTHGSRQGLWPTPEASQGGRQSGSFNQTSWKNADGTPKQPSLAQAAIKELWPTITAHTPDMESSGPNGNSGTYLAGAAKQWATPNAFCYQPPENTEQWTKRAEYQQTEKGVNLHKPVQSQVLHENEKVMGAMPPSASKLNPRWVETLQGVCMGWTSPSCPASVIKNWPKFVSGWCAVTIEQTSFDSSATESCLPQPSELFAF